MNETQIRYNGVTIRNVLTDSIDQVVQLDATGTDPIFVRTTATFTGVLHMSHATNTIGIAGAIYGSEAGDAYRTLIAPLMQPRRRFILTIGNQTVLDVSPGHERVVPNLNAGDRLPIENIDVNHGPLPTVKVLSVVSANTIRIQFSVTLHIPWCDKPGQQPHGIISFRFWIAEDINCEDWTTQRTYHGRVRVAHLGHNVLLEFRRYFWCPALQLGFVRRRISMQQSQNGLELDFTVQDQEVWAVPPPPATKWSGTHTITAPRPGMATLESQLELELSAPKSVPKRALLALMQRIMDAKLHFEDIRLKKQSFIMSAQWRDNLGENRVGASATVKNLSSAYPIADFGLPLNELSPPFRGYNISRAALPAPTATLQGLFLAYLNDPLHVAGWPVSVQVQPTKKATQGDQSQNQDNSGNVPNDTGELSPSHLTAGMYNVYRLASDFDVDTGQLVLPFAKTSNRAATSTTAVVALHNGYATRTVLIEAERLGTWPTLPMPINFTSATGMVHVLLNHHPHQSAPQLSADFKKTLFHVEYELRYALSRVPDFTRNEYLAGLLPYRTAETPEIRFIPATSFVDPRLIL